MSDQPEREEEAANQRKQSPLLPSGRKMSDDELLARLLAHLKERRAVYDALCDTPNRAITQDEIEALHKSRAVANSGLEGLQTADSENKSDAVNTKSVIKVDKTTRYPQLQSDHLEETAHLWSKVINNKRNTALGGRLAMALLRLDECNYDHDCGGEGDYPRCKECRAVRIMRGLIAELGAHGIGHEGLTP